VRDRTAAQRPIALAPRLTEADIAAHRDFVATLGDEPLWRSYLPV
jgi:DNA polymerase-3 subunit epsilon